MNKELYIIFFQVFNDYSLKPGIFCEEIIFQYAHLREWGSCNTYETYATLLTHFPSTGSTLWKSTHECSHN